MLCLQIHVDVYLFSGSYPWSFTLYLQIQYRVHVFFIFRKLPSEFHADFLTENSQVKDRLEALKNRIFSSSIEVYKGSV